MFIYKITNLITGKIYIGRTIRTVQQRYKEHCKAALRGDTGHLHTSMRKYGIENFVICTIDSASSIEELSAKEKYWVAHYNAYGNGYNMTPAGDTNPMDYEKSREKHDLKMRDPVIRNKISASMKAYKKEHPVSSETRMKLSYAAKGNQRYRGRKRPPTAIEATARACRKIVYCVDEEHNLVAKFNSVKEAALWWYANGYGHIKNPSHLCNVIKKNAVKQNTYIRGLMWYYK